MNCHDDVPQNLPQFEGISYLTDDWEYNPEYYDLLAKECGPVPENVDKYSYYRDRYEEYIDGNYYNWEAAFYISEEVFDPDNYNEKSIIRESKITFQSLRNFGSER